MNPLILLITLSGILIVFVVLLLLVFLFAGFGKIMAGNNERAKQKKEVRADERKPSKPMVSVAEMKKPEAPAVESGIPGAVIAAIAAAVAVMGEADGTTYTVRSVRRERTSRPVWAAAGIIENTRPF